MGLLDCRHFLDVARCRLFCSYKIVREDLWDEPKRLANLDKHGMDFADLNEKFFDTAVVLQAKRDRYRAIGVNIRGVISVIFAVYGEEAVSIIGMRPASKAERELYEANRR